MAVEKVAASKKAKTKRNRFGWIPDIPDQRDYLLKTILRVPAKLPRKMDLRPLCSKVEDQGQLGSCTANALAGALEFLEIKDKVYFKDFSRLFIYYNERAMSIRSTPIPAPCCATVSRRLPNKVSAPRESGPMLFRNLR